MLGAFKRVVSRENMNQQGQQDEQASQSQPSPSSMPPNSTLTPNIVDPMDVDESDHNNNNRYNVNQTDDHSATGSTISDISFGGGKEEPDRMMLIDDVDAKMQQAANKPPPAPNSSNNNMNANIQKVPLARTDSRNSSGADSYSSFGRQSSQNSDYGWFEDVHLSIEHGTTPVLKKSKQHQEKTQTEAAAANAASTTPLVMMEQQAAAASNNNSNHTSRPLQKKGKKKEGMISLLPHLALTGEGSTDEMQQVLLDPPLDLETEARAMAVNAPNYVLEESLSSQRLWKDTAGNRPPQPIEERAFYEKMWAANFANSQVHYEMPPEVLTATTPISLSPFADGNFGAKELSNYNLGNADGTASHQVGASGAAGKQQDVVEATLVSRLNDPAQHSTGISVVGSTQHHHLNHEVVNRKIKGSTSDEDLTVLIRGDNVFGTTVSKSFAKPGVNGGPISGVDTVNISIASYRVVESKKRGKYAQFLVIYREGSIRDTIGVWKRYSDFQRLSEKVTKAHEGCAAVIANMSPLAVTEEHDVEHLPNAITSWRLLKKRQRWYRCLDAGYLSLKVFLLERFLHDILFESSTPNLLRDFVKGEDD